MPRYYTDCSEAEIAAAAGISRGAVKSHTARGMAALRAEREQQDRAWKPGRPPPRVTAEGEDDWPSRAVALAPAE